MPFGHLSFVWAGKRIAYGGDWTAWLAVVLRRTQSGMIKAELPELEVHNYVLKCR
jgi:hypothetical protein